MTKSEALKLEYRIKRLPPDKKIFELGRKENGMAITKRDLQSLHTQFKALEKKMDKLIAAAEKSEKPKAAKKAQAKPGKEKTIKNVPAKWAPAKKKTAQMTATDQVLKIINRSKKRNMSMKMRHAR